MSFGTNTVLTREAAWLAQDLGSALPRLLKVGVQDPTAPFDVIQAYVPRQKGNLRAVFVTRTQASLTQAGDGYVSLNRTNPRHAIRLQVWWPLLTQDISAAQQSLDDAVEVLLQRVEGPQFDKSHGGRFKSVGVVSQGIAVTFAGADPAASSLEAFVTYVIDDLELNV